MPFIARLGASTTQLIGVCLAKLPAPLADGFIEHDDPADEQQFFHVTVAERQAEIQPDGVADDLSREPMMFVGIGRCWGRHGSSTECVNWMSRAHSSPEELLELHEYAR